MNFRNDKKRRKVEDDRLSNLPDDLLHKILSCIGTKQVVQTSVLSSRWRFMWTSMPYLNISTEGYPTFPKFKEYVTHVLSCRNNLLDVFSINLRYCEKVNKVGFRKVMKYVVCHKIQQINIVCLHDKKVELPISLFSSKTLKHLSLTKEPDKTYFTRCTDLCLITTMSTWEVPALTSLYLDNVTLCCDENTGKGNGLFSKCANLKNLTLKRCKSYKSKSLSICHPLISTLTIENSHISWTSYSIVLPQLKNLTISNQRGHQYRISAPDLESLVYKGFFPLQLSTEGFVALEKADICVYVPHFVDAPGIVLMLEQLKSVKFLTLNLEIVELLSSSMEVISNHPSPFANLKNLKIYPVDKLSKEEERKNVKMSTEVKNYMLGSSPGATLTMILREHCFCLLITKLYHENISGYFSYQNTILAKKLMAELRKQLEKEKVKTETDKAPMEIKMKPQIGGTTAQIKSCWKDLSLQIQQRKSEAFHIVSNLENIERLLTKLPSSNRAMVQPCFSSLIAEVHIFMSKLTDRVKTHCDENQSRLISLWFQEPTTT